MTDTKSYVYIGVKEDSKDILLDAFLFPQDIESPNPTLLLFPKAKNNTYGLGELVDITDRGGGSYRLKPSGKYLKGHEDILNTFRREDFAAKIKADQKKSLKKSRKDSFKIEDMTIGYLLEMDNRKQRKAIIIWLISKLR